jgi:hypothetical protein
MSEEEFFKCTPKKLDALYKIYKQVKGIESEENETEYIDNILF